VKKIDQLSATPAMMASIVSAKIARNRATPFDIVWTGMEEIVSHRSKKDEPIDKGCIRTWKPTGALEEEMAKTHPSQTGHDAGAPHGQDPTG